MRFFIKLSFNGSLYHGWQIQPNASSVQETLEKALSTVLREPIQLVGAGRTDAGVHAKNYIAHFDTNSKLAVNTLLYKLNSFLPPTIVIHDLKHVNKEAHARFSATFRRYEYLVKEEKDPFLQNLAYKPIKPLDFNIMNEASKILYKYTDFTSFSKLHSDNKTNICHVSHAEWKKQGDVWVFNIIADRFLRNMVRAIVGTLLEVGLYKKNIDEFEQIILEKHRSKAGASVPGEALYLVEVGYPDWVYQTEL